MIYNLESIEVQELIKKDKNLKKLFADIKQVHIEIETDYLKSLINSIISQQISRKVARSISSNFFSYFKDYNPKTILNTSDDEIRSLGFSRPKVKYLKSLLEHIITNEVDLTIIDSLSDEEVINMLTKVTGIGRWTAEMFLIFSLNRKDVYSVLDLGLKEGVKLLYGKDLTNNEILEIASKWSPYKTLVSHFLWRYYEKNR